MKNILEAGTCGQLLKVQWPRKVACGHRTDSAVSRWWGHGSAVRARPSTRSKRSSSRQRLLNRWVNSSR